MLNIFRKYSLVILAMVVIGPAAAAYYYYNEYSAIKNNPNKVAQEEADKLVAQVSKLVVLPEGETPTVATVADPEKLKDQAFFAKAKKGDKVLLYANAKKAVLYDPENNRVVEIAPINIGTPAPTPKASSKNTDED